MSAYPLRLLPRLLEKPWGGDRIGSLYGRGEATDKPIGESWEFFDRPDGSSVIANGPLAGKHLSDLRSDVPLPLLTKVIDARENLSVQVHPDEEAAEEFSGEPKTEAWYIIESAPGALIYKGLKAGVKAPHLLKAMDKGTVVDCLHSFHPTPGDTVYLPPGTVHAIGAGIVLYEVQRNSDTTYRMYDWGRVGLDGKPRDIHRKESVRSTDFSGAGLERVEPRLIEDNGCHRRTHRVSCPYFTMEEHEILGLSTFETEREGRSTYHVVFVLTGEGVIRPFRRGSEEAFFSSGDTILVPAEHDYYEVEPRPGQTVRLLSAYEQ